MLQLSITRVDPGSEFACSTQTSYLGPVVQNHVGLRVFLVSSHSTFAHHDDHGCLRSTHRAKESILEPHHAHTHTHGRRKNSAWPFLKIGHMGSAKICRNRNESTFWQTSMHHTGASNNKKLLRMQTFMHHTSFTYKTSISQNTDAHRPYTKHAYSCPPTTHLVDLIPRRDCGEREWCLERK